MNSPTPSRPDPDQAGYISYVLRLWPTSQGWRASLDNTHTGQRLGFASLEQLFAHLMETIERDTESGST